MKYIAQKKAYLRPEVKIIELDSQDLIATSNPTGSGFDFDGDDDWTK